MGKNIEKYLDNTTNTFNGLAYKDETAFRSDWDKICYIGEYELDNLSIDNDLSDAEIIERGIGYTRNTINEMCKEEIIHQNKISGIDNYIPTNNEINEMAENIFDSADWADISTYVNEYFNYD